MALNKKGSRRITVDGDQVPLTDPQEALLLAGPLLDTADLCG